MTIDPDICWRAWMSRDRRFDGRFFMGVRSTHVYCRPGCPARIPARRNVHFYPSAAAAEAAGFRPCRRCRPETAPGSAAWNGTSATVARALRLIDDGALDDASVEHLAERLGVTARWLRALFAQHVGASPLDVAMTRRVHFARRLLEETALPLVDIAIASGFGSPRRLRAAVTATFRQPPSVLRGSVREPSAALSLRIAARPPFDPAPLFDFYAARAIPGVESVRGGVYRRTLLVDGAPVVVDVRADARAPGVVLRVAPALPRGLLSLATRVTRAFDLDADVTSIAQHLRADALLRRALPRAGVRVPGAWDPFELGVRALLGQQVSVAAARTLAGRLVRECGTPMSAIDGEDVTHLFPDARAVASANLTRIGLPRARGDALRGFARAVADGSLDLHAMTSLDDAIERLTALPGIGAWTAHYIAMRALREPDAFPAGDLVVRKALALQSERAVLARAEAWRPWRAYAVLALWRHQAKEAT